MARLRYLNRSDVEFIAHQLAEVLFKGYPEPLPAFQLVSDNGLALLESALGMPRLPYYPKLHDKAGVLLRSLNKNHALFDGNKRIAMTSTFVFLSLNHQILFASNREMVDFSLRIASDKPDVEWQECALWLRQRTISTKLSREQFATAMDKFAGELRNPHIMRDRLLEYVEAVAVIALS